MTTLANLSRESLLDRLSHNTLVINSTLRQESRHTSNTRRMVKENLSIKNLLK